MKRNIYYAIFLLWSSVLTAQTQTNSDLIFVNNAIDWIKLKPNVEISPNYFFSEYQSALGFKGDYEFKLFKHFDDHLGFDHFRYHQYFKNVRIEGAQYILHSKNNNVLKANGKLVENINTPVLPVLTSKEAISQSLNYINADKYYWEDPLKEQLIKRIKNDPDASFYPVPELVLADEEYRRDGSNYNLCWKVEVFAERHMEKEILFVDAINGGILYTLDGCVTGSGTAVTRYSGTQTICTSTDSAQFVLIDSTRGGGVFTYDMNEGTDIANAVNFYDDDNFWNNANAQLDDAATDAHWGMEMTYDYYLQEHNRNSYDDMGGSIISYVHVDVNWFNATWNGMFSRFGDGNNDPLTSIDIAAHELTHGVTDYTADLIYRNESGALNESFSDIFGVEVKHFGTGDTNNWDIGTASFIIRSVSDPKSHADPDTYFGQHWFTGSGDNGGVHTNSGVQNFWFYIMCVGDTGVNDNGDAYSVSGVGREAARNIAYRNLFAYLTPNSTYLDARQGAIEAAEDLYGSCSFEVHETANAWYACGLGPDTLTPDFRLLTATFPNDGCDLSTNEQFTLTYVFNETGCSDSIAAGEPISLGYQVDGVNPVIETFTFPNTVFGKDTFMYTFNNGADFSASGTYNVDIFINYAQDFLNENDTLFDFEVKTPVNLSAGSNISFEDRIPSQDSFYVVEASHSQAFIQHRAAAHGSDWGLQLNGLNSNLNNITIPSTPADNFTLNPNFGSQACFCVDASTWSKATMVFDLKQTYSRIWDALGYSGANFFTSSMRIMVNGQQNGIQYHPFTFTDDTFITRYVNLDQYAGSTFEACFEGKHFIRWQEDTIWNSEGDHTFIDNVFFSDAINVGVEEIINNYINVYPNPSDGIVYINVNHDMVINSIELSDVIGQVIIVRDYQNQTPDSKVELDLRDLPKGVYFITLKSEKGNYSERILLH